MDITMRDATEFNLRLVVGFLTADDQLADIDGAHTVNSSNPSIASVLSQDDSTQQHEVIFELHPTVGQTILSGSADADLGTGERFVSWSFPLNVFPNQAERASVSVGELIPKAQPSVRSARGAQAASKDEESSAAEGDTAGSSRRRRSASEDA